MWDITIIKTWDSNTLFQQCERSRRVNFDLIRLYRQEMKSCSVVGYLLLLFTKCSYVYLNVLWLSFLFTTFNYHKTRLILTFALVFFGDHWRIGGSHQRQAWKSTLHRTWSTVQSFFMSCCFWTNNKTKKNIWNDSSSSVCVGHVLVYTGNGNVTIRRVCATWTLSSEAPNVPELRVNLVTQQDVNLLTMTQTTSWRPRTQPGFHFVSNKATWSLFSIMSWERLSAKYDLMKWRQNDKSPPPPPPTGIKKSLVFQWTAMGHFFASSKQAVNISLALQCVLTDVVQRALLFHYKLRLPWLSNVYFKLRNIICVRSGGPKLREASLWPGARRFNPFLIYHH